MEQNFDKIAFYKNSLLSVRQLPEQHLEKSASLWYDVKNPRMEDTTMTDAERRAAAKQFAAYWTGKGDEKQETQRFWITDLVVSK